ncbi:hypothetical protein D083_4380 [Dickeya solani RNS 08.23.3.1.A]|nr:hypothetical protein D083_4380 [Dickeya solani RNS 08.23.3.1.A]
MYGPEGKNSERPREFNAADRSTRQAIQCDKLFSTTNLSARQTSQHDRPSEKSQDRLCLLNEITVSER